MERTPSNRAASPDELPSEFDYLLIPVAQLFEDAARNYPDHPFLVLNDASQTYRRMNEIANQVAHFLRASGVQQGDRVAMFLPNLPHFPAVLFGALKIGAVCVTCNPTYSAPELHHQLLDSGARCLFAMDHPTLYATACAALQDTAVETVVYCNVGNFLPIHQRILGGLMGKLPHAKQHTTGHIAFDVILRQYPHTPLNQDIDPLHDLALIQYTGGTTGTPKDACMTHANLVSNLFAIHRWVHPVDENGKVGEMQIGGECFMGVLPWYHAYGLVMTLLVAVKIASRVARTIGADAESLYQAQSQHDRDRP